jgi:hypothetical protein
MPPQNSEQTAANSKASAVSKKDYLSLADFLEGREIIRRVHKKEPHSEALRKAGEMYQNREYVSAYECLKPVYDRVVADMQRILARNLEFQANKLARERQKSLAAAKEIVQSMRANAQQMIDQFDRLLRDLESKPLVRAHQKKRASAHAAAAPTPAAEVALPTALNTATETRLDANAATPLDIVIGEAVYRKVPYSPPNMGTLYCVRDKVNCERIVRVIGKSPDGAAVQVEALENGVPSKRPMQLAVDALSRQAAKGWCSMLVPVTENVEAAAGATQPVASNNIANVTLRLDIQNFGRCCADIVRANIKFDTQLIKDVGDGPFRAGQYDKAFLTFEQFAGGFTSAVASSRRAIEDGRRDLMAEKGKLSGKEIEERKAAFIRNEQLIHTAEREFSTILEGLRMYLRAQQG